MLRVLREVKKGKEKREENFFEEKRTAENEFQFETSVGGDVDIELCRIL
jgi:hypothetical protein